MCYISSKFKIAGGDSMAFKKMDQNLGFADLALKSSLKHNRSLKTMERLDKAIDWSRIQEILHSHYTVGTSNEGADAYPPLLLFKCLLIQKWFRINSDPELENQINDRLSFNSMIQFFLKPCNYWDWKDVFLQKSFALEL